MLKETAGLKSGGLLLLLVLAAALAVRTYALHEIPSLNQDEASIAYNSFAVAESGRDYWGSLLPLSMEAFGGFMPPLYPYLAVVPIALLGLDEVPARLVSVVLGILTVLAVFLLTKTVSGDSKAALAAAALIALSPWPVHNQRMAFEASIMPFFIAAGAFLLLRGVKEGDYRSFIASAFVLALSFYTYPVSRLFVPLLLLAFAVCFSKELLKMGVKRLGAWAVVFVLASLPMAYDAASNESYNARFQMVSVFSNVARENWVETIFSNYLSFHSLDYLFFKGDGSFFHNVVKPDGTTLGVLPVYALPLFLAGVAFLLFNLRKPEAKLVLLWLLLYSLPASLTAPAPNVLRANAGLPALYVTAGLGVAALSLFFNSLAKARPAWQKAFAKTGFIAVMALVSLLLALELASFYSYYFSPAKDGFVDRQGWAYYHGWREAYEYVKQVEGNYGAVVVSHDYSTIHDYIFTVFYLRYPPSRFSREAQRYPNGPWSDVTRVGKFHFCDLRLCLGSIPGSKLVVAKRNDLVEGKLLKQVKTPSGAVSLAVYEMN